MGMWQHVCVSMCVCVLAYVASLHYAECNFRSFHYFRCLKPRKDEETVFCNPPACWFCHRCAMKRKQQRLKQQQKNKTKTLTYFLQPLMSFSSLRCDAYILACSWSEYNTDYVFFFLSFSHFRCNQNAHTLKKYKMQNKQTSLEQLFACACGFLSSLAEQTGMSSWCYTNTH